MAIWSMVLVGKTINCRRQVGTEFLAFIHLHVKVRQK